MIAVLPSDPRHAELSALCSERARLLSPGCWWPGEPDADRWLLLAMIDGRLALLLGAG